MLIIALSRKADMYDIMMSTSHVTEHLGTGGHELYTPFKNVLLMGIGQFLIHPLPHGSWRWQI